MANERSQFVGFLRAWSRKAVLFQDHFWHKAKWLPRSQLDLEADEGDDFIVRVSAWLCRKQRLTEFKEDRGE